MYQSEGSHVKSCWLLIEVTGGIAGQIPFVLRDDIMKRPQKGLFQAYMPLIAQLMAPRSHQQVELGQKSHRCFSCSLHLRSWRSAVRFTHRLAAWEQGLKSGKAGKKRNAWWVCEAPGKWTAWLLSIWINHDSYGFNGGFWSFWSMRLVGWTMRCVRRLFRNVALPGIPDPVAPTYASCLRPQHVDIEHHWHR